MTFKKSYFCVGLEPPYSTA